jgi:hypothetical protein
MAAESLSLVRMAVKRARIQAEKLLTKQEA